MDEGVEINRHSCRSTERNSLTYLRGKGRILSPSLLQLFDIRFPKRFINGMVKSLRISDGRVDNSYLNQLNASASMYRSALQATLVIRLRTTCLVYRIRIQVLVCPARI